MDAAWHSDLAEIYFMITFITSARWKNMKKISFMPLLQEKKNAANPFPYNYLTELYWKEKKKTLLALLSADMIWTEEIHLGLHCRVKVQHLSFCPWPKCPRWAACAEYILLPAGHTCIQQDSSASSPSSTRPVKHQVRLHYTAIYSSNQSVFSAIIRK